MAIKCVFFEQLLFRIWIWILKDFFFIKVWNKSELFVPRIYSIRITISVIPVYHFVYEYWSPCNCKPPFYSQNQQILFSNNKKDNNKKITIKPRKRNVKNDKRRRGNANERRQITELKKKRTKVAKWWWVSYRMNYVSQTEQYR